MNKKATEVEKHNALAAIYREGAECAQRLGSNARLNPHPHNSPESAQWLKGFSEASGRLNELFLAWLALGHSIPKLAIGKTGQALGPMVAGLVASNGNTAGALLVGSLASHEGETLAEILPKPTLVRQAFEATQYGITGHELPETHAIVGKFFDRACEIDRFREPGTETEVAAQGEGKVARVKFDLAAYLQALVEGIPAEEKEGGSE
jgi:hypothetical protein